MPIKFQIYRVLFLVLGISQVPTNLVYLLTKNGLINARKQHQELPKNLTDKQIKYKVVCMAIFGSAFLALSIYSFATNSFLDSFALVVLILFSCYAVIEALYYKYWRTIGFALITIILLLLFIFL